MGCFGLRKLVRKKSSLENNNHRVYTVVHRWEAVNPPVHEKEPTKEKALNVVDDAPSEEILARDESLWNRAYQQLDQGLVNRYEDLLAKEREQISELFRSLFARVFPIFRRGAQILTSKR